MFGKSATTKGEQTKTVETVKKNDRPAGFTSRDDNIQHSILSADSTLTGDLNSKGDVTVEGTVDGNIKCRCLTLSGEPAISGSANAESVIVSGTFNGEVRAKKVVLTKTAKMHGDIFKETLEIHPGAAFEGKVARFDAEKATSAGSTKHKKRNGAELRAEPALTQQPAA
jgi:cytoskeletal protein CcmA (bactofilin family)